LAGVEVIARGSSTPYRKTTKTQRDVARELDVKYLLTATVRWEKSGGASRVQVSPELVEVKESGAPASRWQQPFDAALTDVFRVQSDIASRVAQALGVALGAGDERRLSEKPTQNLAAYDAFLRGEESIKGVEPPTLRRRIAFYEQAVALDPAFALAWARLSVTSALLYSFSTPSPELGQRARQSAERALSLAPDLPEGYLAIGDYHSTVQADMKQALDQYSRGLRLAPAHPQLLSATAEAEMSLGSWQDAVARLQQAVRLDPRSIRPILGLASAFTSLRRYAEAREVLDRGLAINPASLNVIDIKAATYLGEGDLSGARAVLKAAPKEVEPTALVAYLANYGDLAWVLDESERKLLLRLTPSAFDDDRATWGLSLAQACALNGDAAGVRTYAEEARRAFEEQVKAAPQNAQRRVLLGLALAYLGRKEEAIREGNRSMELTPVTRDAALGPYDQHQLVRIYILVGENEKALDELEQLLRIPYDLSPAWLRIDPNFDPLRKNPRFQKLVAGN
jgi:tetratricopeptide (TPR) repeat protein